MGSPVMAMKYPPEAARSDIEISTGFFLLSAFISCRMSSEAMPSPPGESMRRITPLMLESSATCRRTFTMPNAVMPLSETSSPGSPRVISPSPVT